MWPTPTPFPTPAVSPTLPVDLTGMVGTFSDGIIQGWNMFDASPFATFVFFIIVVTIVILGIISIRQHLEKL